MIFFFPVGHVDAKQWLGDRHLVRPMSARSLLSLFVLIACLAQLISLASLPVDQNEDKDRMLDGSQPPPTGTTNKAAGSFGLSGVSDEQSTSFATEDKNNGKTSSARPQSIGTGDEGRERNERGITLSIPKYDYIYNYNYSYLHVLKETTKLLYENSRDLDFWMSQPAPKIYIYDNVPDHMSSVENVSQCVNDHFLGADAKWDRCGWKPTVCNDGNEPLFGHQKLQFVANRYNYNNDVAFLDLFLTYPGRTFDPNEADLFVVPYPHRSHCLCQKDFKKKRPLCSYSRATLERDLYPYLTHLDRGAPNSRHLFLLGSDWYLSMTYLRMSIDMSLSLGPADGCLNKRGKRRKTSCGHIIIPYVSTGIEHQPNALSNLDEAWWTTRERLYSVGTKLGVSRALTHRRKFMSTQEEILGPTIGGLPTMVTGLNNQARSLESADSAMEIYRNSTFCPVLPGDGTPQKRFFDVIMSGCIPVVYVFPGDEDGWPSFHPHRVSLTRSYPFAKGVLFNDTNAGVDIESLVIAINGTCGVPCMKETLEAEIANTETLTHRRLMLRKYASLFALGLDSEQHSSVDAFSATIVTLRHHLHHLPPRNITSPILQTNLTSSSAI
jgi:hypothetical protein